MPVPGRVLIERRCKGYIQTFTKAGPLQFQGQDENLEAFEHSISVMSDKALLGLEELLTHLARIVVHHK